MKIPNMKNIIDMNDENKTKLIGLLTILIVVWMIFYIIPELFVSLFNTILGNLILLLTILLVYVNNRTYGITLGLICILLFRFSRLSKEGFTQNSVNDFLNIQNTINKQKIFDINVMENQVTQDELDFFNQNGYWNWSQNTIDLYEDAVSKNKFIRTLPVLSRDYAKTIYNEAAILRILSYQTKEGQFLLDGVIVNENKNNLPSGMGNFAYTSGLATNNSGDIIRCNLKDNSNPSLERITNINEYETKSTPVDYNDLESIVPGFTFLDSPCNPCESMSSVPNYSCKFKLKTDNKPSYISNVWKYLWNVN